MKQKESTLQVDCHKKKTKKGFQVGNFFQMFIIKIFIFRKSFFSSYIEDRAFCIGIGNGKRVRRRQKVVHPNGDCPRRVDKGGRKDSNGCTLGCAAAAAAAPLF